MTKSKCICKVNILGSNRTRACKGAIYINLNDKNYCWSHAKQVLGYWVTIIQSTARSMICRKNLKNLYINLPDEIKNIVLFYLRQDFYYIKYKKFCTKIIENKVNKVDNLLTEVLHQYIDREDFIRFLSNIFSLFINNWHIIDFNNLEDNNLIKLYILARLKVWGKTTWDGRGLSNIFNSVYNFNYELMNNFEILLSNFEQLWENKFIYIRKNSYNAVILLR